VCVISLVTAEPPSLCTDHAARKGVGSDDVEKRCALHALAGCDGERTSENAQCDMQLWRPGVGCSALLL